MQALQSLARPLGALAITAALAGCVTAPKPLESGAAAKIKRVDVISVAAGEFNRTYVGLTVFNNDKETLPIADWGIDKAYEDQLTAVITAGRDITVTRSPYQRERFVKANEVNRGWDGGYAWKDIESATRDHCAANSLDALFVLNRSWSGDIFAGTNQSFNGIGLFSRGGAGPTRSYLHAVTTLALLDCQTGQPLAIRLVARTQEGLPGDIARSIPYRSISFSKPKKPISTWTEAELAQMRETLTQMPQSTWPIAVDSILPAKAQAR